jgi:hypothetical protein
MIDQRPKVMTKNIKDQNFKHKIIYIYIYIVKIYLTFYI